MQFKRIAFFSSVAWSSFHWGYWMLAAAAILVCCGSVERIQADDNAKPVEKKQAKGADATPIKSDDKNAAKNVEKNTDKNVEKKKVEKKTEVKKNSISLLTDDGLRLGVNYYPGTKGKSTVPVVLLHMWKQSRADYEDLAGYLQSQGYACIVPDLRGHGQSTRFKGGAKDDELLATALKREDLDAMVTQDMNAIKKYLWECNNNGELNLRKLCVVGAEMGATVAMNFAVYDDTGYDKGMASYGPLELGKFVKAMVLISPEWSFKGATLKNASSNQRVVKDISVLVLVGKEDRKFQAEAKRVVGIFERYHIEPSEDEKAEKKSLFFIPLDTSLQGTKLLEPRFKAKETIAEFIDRRLNKNEQAEDWEWKELKQPFE